MWMKAVVKNKKKFDHVTHAVQGLNILNNKEQKKQRRNSCCGNIQVRVKLAFSTWKKEDRRS